MIERTPHLLTSGTIAKQVGTDRDAVAYALNALPNGLRMSDLSIGRYLRSSYTGDWSEAQAEQEVMSGAERQ